MKIIKNSKSLLAEIDLNVGRAAFRWLIQIRVELNICILGLEQIKMFPNHVCID